MWLTQIDWRALKVSLKTISHRTPPVSPRIHAHRPEGPRHNSLGQVSRRANDALGPPPPNTPSPEGATQSSERGGPLLSPLTQAPALPLRSPPLICLQKLHEAQECSWLGTMKRWKTRMVVLRTAHPQSKCERRPNLNRRNDKWIYNRQIRALDHRLPRQPFACLRLEPWNPKRVGREHVA